MILFPRRDSLATGLVLAGAVQPDDQILLAVVKVWPEEVDVALREAGVGNENNLAKDPNAPNPPSNHVKGKIESVDTKDRTLVQISLGTDQGIQLNHTLEVYRVDPPQYLGRIRIVDAKEHAAAGKLTTGNRIPLQVGDIVASSLNNQSR